MCRRSEKAAVTTELSEYYTLWAHQIKTPIAAMRLIIQSSDESEENSDLAEQLFKIEEYVDMVLNFVKSSDGSSDYIFKMTDISEIVKGVIRKF